MPKANLHFLKNKRIAITGGTGFIGSHLIEKILEQQPSAIRVISAGSGTERLKNHLTELEVKVHKNAREYIRHIVDFKPDYLFILGGNSDPRLSVTNPRLDLEYNLLYNFKLLQRLSRKPSNIKIIYISSVAVYANDTKPLNEELSLASPKSPYGINKLAMEGYIRFFAETYKIAGFSVRLSATYGPGLKKQVVFDFIQKLMKDPTQLSILGDGSEIRDFCYVDDQVNGLLLLAKKAPYKGEVYNLGSGEGISVADLAKKIINFMGLKPKIIFEKTKQEKHHGHTWVLDITKARELGHQPQTSIDSGLEQTIKWVTRQ